MQSSVEEGRGGAGAVAGAGAGAGTGGVAPEPARGTVVKDDAVAARPSAAWALLVLFGAAALALGILVLAFDYYRYALAPSVVLLVLGLLAAVAGSVMSRSRACLVVLAWLVGVVLGVVPGAIWMCSLYCK
jgi:hypothetical protein